MHARSYLELALVPPVILVPSPTRAVGARAESLILVSSLHLSLELSDQSFTRA